MQSNRLTRRQREVYHYLQAHQARFGDPPTLDDICRALGLRSRGSLHKHIRALVEADLIEPLEGRRRGIRLKSPRRETSLPLLGRIAAGRPIEAIAQGETIDIPAPLQTSNACYVLEVRGDSMAEAGILDGDWVVIEPRDTARNGEMVVALIDGEEATLKRIEQQPGRILLHAANSAYPPLVYSPERITIQGVVIGQMRAYR